MSNILQALVWLGEKVFFWETVEHTVSFSDEDSPDNLCQTACVVFIYSFIRLQLTTFQCFSCFSKQEHEKRCWSVDFNLMDPKLLASGSDDAKGIILLFQSLCRGLAFCVFPLRNKTVIFQAVNSSAAFKIVADGVMCQGTTELFRS